MAGLVPATQTRWRAKWNLCGAAVTRPAAPVLLGGRDKPGHDDWRGGYASA